VLGWCLTQPSGAPFAEDGSLQLDVGEEEEAFAARGADGAEVGPGAGS
jgi:hypothetical protein